MAKCQSSDAKVVFTEHTPGLLGAIGVGNNLAAGIPLVLPFTLLTDFTYAFTQQLKKWVRVYKCRALVNFKEARFFWNIWLNLDRAQQDQVREHLDPDALAFAVKQFAQHPAVVQQMLDPVRRLEYWSVGEWHKYVTNHKGE